MTKKEPKTVYEAPRTLLDLADDVDTLLEMLRHEVEAHRCEIDTLHREIADLKRQVDDLEY